MSEPVVNDPINPNHYKGVLVIPAEMISDYRTENGDISLEYIDVMRFMMTPEEFVGHLKGQAFKYQLRLGRKDDSVQELGKAGWYLDRLAKFLKTINNKG